MAIIAKLLLATSALNSFSLFLILRALNVRTLNSLFPLFNLRAISKVSAFAEVSVLPKVSYDLSSDLSFFGTRDICGYF